MNHGNLKKNTTPALQHVMNKAMVDSFENQYHLADQNQVSMLGKSCLVVHRNTEVESAFDYLSITIEWSQDNITSFPSQHCGGDRYEFCQWKLICCWTQSLEMSSQLCTCTARSAYFLDQVLIMLGQKSVLMFVAGELFVFVHKSFAFHRNNVVVIPFDLFCG